MLPTVGQWAIEVLNQTVQAELFALPKEMQARFLRISELLENFGPQHVGMPHVRPLGEKLWEMRLTRSGGIGRAIYTAASRRRLVVLHAFVKKTQKTPQRALDIARRRIEEIQP
jgi:phage-related protein